METLASKRERGRKMIENFFQNLKRSMEAHSSLLKSGKLFLPEFLQESKFTRSFKAIMSSLAKSCNLRLEVEVNNPMPKGYECGTRQRVDYAFYQEETPQIFLEPSGFGFQFCQTLVRLALGELSSVFNEQVSFFRFQ